MPASQNGADGIRDRSNIFRMSGLGIEHLGIFISGEVLHHLIRNDGREFLDLRRTEGRDALTKDADDSEVQVIQLHLLSKRILLGEKRIGQLLRQQRDLVARGHVLGIEEPPGKDFKIADLLEAFRDADHTDRPLVTFDDDRHRKISSAGDFDDFRDLLANGSYVGQGDLVGQRSRFTRAGELGVGDVRTNAFDLGDDVTLTGERHGDYEHDAAAADNDAQHGQHGLHLVGTKGLYCDLKCLSPNHSYKSKSIARLRSKARFRYSQQSSSLCTPWGLSSTFWRQ